MLQDYMLDRVDEILDCAEIDIAQGNFEGALWDLREVREFFVSRMLWQSANAVNELMIQLINEYSITVSFEPILNPEWKPTVDQIMAYYGRPMSEIIGGK